MTETKPQPVKKKRRWWWIPLGLGLLLALLLTGLLYSSQGLFLSLQLIDRFAPGFLQVERAEGNLFGTLRLQGVRLRLPDLQMDLERAQLRWSPWSALGGTLRVQELALQGLQVRSRASESPDQKPLFPLQLPDIALPLGIDLQQFSLKELQLQNWDGTPNFALNRAELSAALSPPGTLQLRRLELDLPQPKLSAHAVGQMNLQGAYPLDLSLHWQLSRAPALQLQGDFQVQGDLDRLQLRQEIEGSAQVKLEAILENLLQAPRWQAQLQLKQIDFPAISAELPPLDLGGQLRTQGDLQQARLQGTLRGQDPQHPDFGKLSADLDLGWQGHQLTISQLDVRETRSGALLTALGKLDFSKPEGPFDLRAAWEQLRWPLTGAARWESRQGKLDVSGTFADYAYALNTQLWGQDLPSVQLSARGQGDQASTRIEQLALKALGGQVSLAGQLGWQPEPRWALKLQGSDLQFSEQWPEVPLALKTLSLDTEGNLQAFRYALRGTLLGKDLPKVAIDLKGQGDQAQTQIQSLRLDSLGGFLQARGRAAWEPQVRWQADLRWADLNPGRHWSDWPGKLAGSLITEGQLGDQGPALTAALKALKGKLRGYPVQARGKLQLQGKSGEIQALQLASGPSQLKLSGAFGEALNLQIAVQSPDLSSLLPDAAGSIDLQGEISGTRQAPVVHLDLNAQKLALGAQGIQRLAGKVALNLAEGGEQHIELSGQGLKAGDLNFSKLSLQGRGTLPNHQLSLTLAGKPLGLQLQTKGGWQGNAYEGQIAGLGIQTQKFGDWRLQSPAALRFREQRFQLGDFCLREQGGSGGCLSFSQTGPQGWKAGLDRAKLSFDLLAKQLPEPLKLQGALEAKADFQARGNRLTGTAQLRIPKGQLRAEIGDGQRVDFSSTQFDLKADGNGLGAQLQLALGKLGAIQGTLRLPHWSLGAPARPDQPLAGRWKGSIPDLSTLSHLVPDLSDLGGALRLDLGIQGTLEQPAFQGYARLTQGRLQVPLIGLQLTEVHLEARASNPNRIDYRGELSAGTGQLRIEGQTRIQPKGWDTRLQAQGERLILANTEEYFLAASPQLQLTATPKGAEIQGTIRVPEARVEPRSLPPGTRSPSPDVVIRGQESNAAAYPLQVDLRLVLGEQVKINAFGLNARLAGDLRLLKRPGKLPLGDGQLAVLDGTYRISTGTSLTAAIGKPLKVTQGLIVFAKTPLSNPGLVLTAKREGGDMTAGIRVFGTLKDPKLTFFSDTDPGMTQSEITNYLITGIPPGGNRGEGGLSLGTYVAPKLFMEYENSLGSAQDKVRLRYEYNNWMEFQTETGESQGADVFFKFER